VLPSKILEATAMAKPTILGVEGYAAQFLREADAGICIEPENADQMSTLAWIEVSPGSPIFSNALR